MRYYDLAGCLYFLRPPPYVYKQTFSSPHTTSDLGGHMPFHPVPTGSRWRLIVPASAEAPVAPLWFSGVLPCASRGRTGHPRAAYQSAARSVALT